MSADPIVWEEPQKAGRGTKGDVAALLAPLLQNPGRWARVRVNAKRENLTSLCDAIKGGKQSYRYDVPPGRWEAVTRKLYDGDEQGQFGLYVRYMGEEAK